jgi:hypothetical protein
MVGKSPSSDHPPTLPDLVLHSHPLLFPAGPFMRLASSRKRGGRRDVVLPCYSVYPVALRIDLLMSRSFRCYITVLQSRLVHLFDCGF